MSPEQSESPQGVARKIVDFPQSCKCVILEKEKKTFVNLINNQNLLHR